MLSLRPTTRSMLCSAGRALNSAITMVYYIYDMFFNRGQVHYASAAAIFLAIVLALTVIQKWVSRFVYSCIREGRI